MNPYIVNSFRTGLIFREGVDNEVEYCLQKEGFSKNRAQEFCNKTKMSQVDDLSTVQDLDDRKYDFMTQDEKYLLSTLIDRLKIEHEEWIQDVKRHEKRVRSQNFRRMLKRWRTKT
jgi:hypothetical protein